VLGDGDSIQAGIVDHGNTTFAARIDIDVIITRTGGGHDFQDIRLSQDISRHFCAAGDQAMNTFDRAQQCFSIGIVDAHDFHF
jgi:hypothetical protein